MNLNKKIVSLLQKKKLNFQLLSLVLEECYLAAITSVSGSSKSIYMRINYLLKFKPKQSILNIPKK